MSGYAGLNPLKNQKQELVILQERVKNLYKENVVHVVGQDVLIDKYIHSTIINIKDGKYEMYEIIEKK